MLEKILEKAQKQNKKIMIIAHKQPDGDAIASSKTLESFFEKKGIDAKYIVISKPKNSYSAILGYTKQTKKSNEGDYISIILDTAELNNIENTAFIPSNPEDIYVIDHHEKSVNEISTEDGLNVPKSNVLRAPNFSSTCEILERELHNMKALNPDLSTKLLVGVCTDTATFRYLKPNTLENLKLLLKTGGNFSRVQGVLNKRRSLKSEVGLAKAFLGVQRIKIGNTYINYLGLDNNQVKQLQKKYEIKNIPRKILKLANIEDTSINMVIVEEQPNVHECEFRSISFCGNVNVFSLADKNGGGGVYNASGCTIRSQESTNAVSRRLLEELTSESLEQLHSFTPKPETENDPKLYSLLSRMKFFTKTPSFKEIDALQELLKSDVNYLRTYENLISFNKFMLINEFLVHIPYNELDKKDISLTFDENFLNRMQKKYGATVKDLLDAATIVKELEVNSTTIHIPGQKDVVLDKFGKQKSFTK